MRLLSAVPSLVSIGFLSSAAAFWGKKKRCFHNYQGEKTLSVQPPEHPQTQRGLIPRFHPGAQQQSQLLVLGLPSNRTWLWVCSDGAESWRNLPLSCGDPKAHPGAPIPGSWFPYGMWMSLGFTPRKFPIPHFQPGSAPGTGRMGTEGGCSFPPCGNFRC